ncbi:MAG: hypothetical protein ACLFOY_19425 [Desulfatibacillaceae bacterium]
MAVTHKNRKGMTYYLHEHKTRTGKPRYVFSTKKGDNLVESLPPGYEIYESPKDGRVFLRKARPTEISEIEKKLVEKHLGKLPSPGNYIVDLEQDAIVVYEADRDTDHIDSIIGGFMNTGELKGRRDKGRGGEQMARSMSTFSAKMRFVLSQKDLRWYRVERFCYLGGIEDWIDLEGPDSLGKLAEKYIKHIDKESFYDLY